MAPHGSVKRKLYTHVGDSLIHDNTTLVLAGLALHANDMIVERWRTVVQLAPPLYTSLLCCRPLGHSRLGPDAVASQPA